MDKQTLSGYGWIVIVTLILAVLLALATPFGTYVGDGVVTTVNGLINTSSKAVDEDQIDTMSDKWENKFSTFDKAGSVNGGESNGSNELDLSTINTDLATNTWEDVQKVVSAGKAAEAGWAVGDTKTLTINGQEKEATLIGINHDGENTATFMVISDIGSYAHAMNSNNSNDGGWKDSEMRSWLNNDIYNSMSNKDYIKEITKMTDNVGYSDSKTNTVDDVTGTQDKVFLLSVVEAGLQDTTEDYEYPYMNQINGEGTTYEWFTSNNLNNKYTWLRSPRSNKDSDFFVYDTVDAFCSDEAQEEGYTVFAAFVIG